MSRVLEMRGLTEDLARSHDERMADLRARRADVQSALEATRQARVSEAAELRKQRGDDASGRREAVANTLSGIFAARSAMASEQYAVLSRGRAALTADTKGFLDELRGSHAALTADTKGFLDELGG